MSSVLVREQTKSKIHKCDEKFERSDKMAIEYKIDVLKSLKEVGYSSAKLRKEKIMGEATIQRLRHKQTVSFDVLSKLCYLLNCEIGDILVYKKDDTLENSAELTNDTE